MNEPSPMLGIKPRIRHTMLPVKDIGRSIDFYQRLLGMDVLRRRRDDVKQLDAVYVGYGDENRNPCLELIQDVSAGAPGTLPPWTGHIALAVTGLRNISTYLANEGVKFLRPVEPRAPGSKDLIAMILDPDGYQIELHDRAGDNVAVA